MFFAADGEGYAYNYNPADHDRMIPYVERYGQEWERIHHHPSGQWSYHRAKKYYQLIWRRWHDRLAGRS